METFVILAFGERGSLHGVPRAKIAKYEYGGINTSVNPFKEKVAEFMVARRGCIGEVTTKNLERRFRRIERDLLNLKEDGKVSTMSPSKMTEQDIKELIILRKNKGVSASDVNHDISAMKQLCTFCKNTCVQNCIGQNPGLKPVEVDERLEPLSDENYRKILARSREIDPRDYQALRPYAMVLLYICTGARNKELRLAEVSDIDMQEWTINYRHVKAENTWGRSRKVPIPEDIQDLVRSYIKARNIFLIKHDMLPEEVPALFCSMYGDHEVLSSNTIRKLKTYVERDIGHKFELRDCRRAFGQHYKDNHTDLEDISKLMGHKTTRTTELYYAEKRQSEVIRNVRGKW